MTTRLTIHPLLYFFLRYRLIHAVGLRLVRFQNYTIRCGTWVGAVSGVQLNLAIYSRSEGIIRVADRVSIVEGHEESIGIPAKRW
jgi:hypothetical protein